MRTSHSIEQLIEMFVADQQVAAISKKHYDMAITQFFNWAVTNELNPRSLNRNDVIRFNEHLVKSKKSSLTIDSYLSAVRRFYTWCDSKSFYSNIATGIRSPRRYKNHKKDYLRAHQVEELFKSIDRNTESGLRDFAMIALMLNTGMRCIEVSRANVCDIRLRDNNWVIYIQGKGKTDKQDYVGISENTYHVIDEYLVARETDLPDDPLFISQSNRNTGIRMTSRAVSSTIKRRFVGIGLNSKRLTAHSLRHTTAINLLKLGMSIYDVQCVLRHTSTSTTEIYTKAIGDEIRLTNGPGKLMDRMIYGTLNEPAGLK